MSDWVRFHRELCKGVKRGIPRALRFVYMELSLEARAKGGYIPLPVGMADYDAVHDLLSGNREELDAALRLFTSGPDPILRFEDMGAIRVLTVVAWRKWNTNDPGAAKRQRKSRDGKRDVGRDSHRDTDRDAHRDDARDRHGTNERDDVVPSDRDVTESHGDARARADLPLISSESESSEGEQGEPVPAEHESSTRIRAGAALNETADGGMGYIVRAWADGIRSVTGVPFAVPRGRELEKLLAGFEAHGPRGAAQREPWAREAGEAYATARRGSARTLNSHDFIDWLNSGRPTQAAPAKAVAPLQSSGKAPLWKVGK